MKGATSVIMFLAGLSILTIPLSAQTITLDEFLDQLKTVHPLFEKEEFTARIETENRKSLEGAQDWNLFSSVAFSHEKPAIAIFGPERTDISSVSGGLKRTFWKTGGRFSTSVALNRVDLKVNPLYGIPDSYYQNQFSVSYIHPFLQNSGGFLDRLRYELKQFDIDFSEVLARENQEDFLAGSAKKFLEWVFLVVQKDIIRARLNLSLEALDNTREKRRANLIDEVDVLRAEDAVRIARQNLVLVNSQGKGLQAELAVLSQNEDLYNLSPEFDLYGIVPLPPVDHEIMQLEKEARLIETVDIRLKQLEYSRLGYKETTKPQLSLVAQFNLKAAEDNFGDALRMDKADFFGGLEFAIPLENRTAQSNVEMSELQIAQLKRVRDEIRLDLAAALTNLHIQIGELVEILKLNIEQIESAGAKTREELKLYEQGRSDLTFVIQSQDGEQNARLNYAANAMTYQKLLIEYRALMDRLYPNNQL